MSYSPFITSMADALAQPTCNANSIPYTGPCDCDPLTEEELSILLAIPRAAQTTPDAPLFRLPLGPDPALGWVDVTCIETYSIVSRLAAVWNTRLTDILHKRAEGAQLECSVGPGTTICIVVQPSVHALFHLLAFWALGCTVKYICTYVSDEIVDSSLRDSGCRVVLYAGMDDTWVSNRESQFDGEMVQLPVDEYAHQLACREKEGAGG